MNQGFEMVQTDGLEISSNVRSADQMGRAFEKANPTPKEAPEAPEPAEVEDETPEQPEPAVTAPDQPKAEEKPGHKASKNPRVRIEEATREAAQAKREREELQKRADEIQRRADAAEAELRRYREQHDKPKEEKAAAPKADGRPKLEDFENLEDFTDAVTEWKLADREKTAKQRESEVMRERAREGRMKAFSERIQAHLKTDPNFFDKVDQNLVQLRPLSELGPSEPRNQMNLAADYILDSEEPAKLFEYFTAHPEEVRRFLTLHPMQIGKEIGKIEGRLGAAITAPVPEPEVSKASPPARPVAGGPPTVGEPGPNASFEEWARHEDAKAERERLSRLKKR